MARRVFTTHPGAVLLDAYEIMQDHRVRHVPVVEDGKLIGIVSDRDVRSALPSRQRLREGTASLGGALLGTRISEVMTLMPFTTTPGASIREAAQLMCRQRVGALPVVDEAGRLVGIISSKDVLWAIADGEITPSASSRRPE
jgi:acetoin utilization protein AcuB